MFKLRFQFLVMFILSTSLMLGQTLFQGPADGLSDPGIKQNTSDFSTNNEPGRPRFGLYKFNEEEENVKPVPNPVNMVPPTGPEGANYITDPAFSKMGKIASQENWIEFENFNGIPDEADPQGYSRIPPDTYIAAGPSQLVQIVNSRVRITDKKGNILKELWAYQWYANLGIPSIAPFDPKITYDQIDKRWIMVWLHVDDAASKAYILVSVSEDSSAIGNWYSWALPATVNGSTPDGRWSDYEGVGYDDQAVYITSNQFTFAGDKPATAKIRIIPKSDLYANTVDPVSFRDLYDVKYPDNNVTAFGIRPARMYSNTGEFYLLTSSMYTTKTSVGLYKLKDPMGNVSLTGEVIPVNAYSNPPNADQLGGSTTLIEGGGSANFRNEPFFKDGILYAVHNIASGSSNKYSSIRFLAIDVEGGGPVIDVSFGHEGFWYYYPAVAVDNNNNVMITYSRSGLTQYAGAYYTIFPFGSSVPIGSDEMQPGYGNYVKTFGGDRNRWGDYNGAWLDPSDGNNIWLYSEYAAAKNTWGTWVTGVRLTPLSGINSFVDNPILDFGNIEINTSSNIQLATIKNQGDQNLVISQVNESVSPFHIQANVSFPATLAPFDSLQFQVYFAPSDTGDYIDTLRFTSNDSTMQNIALRGHGYNITAAKNRVMYASSGRANDGNILTVDPATGASTEIGPSLFDEVKDIAIDPKSGIIYGVISSKDASSIVRVNSSGGDSYLVFGTDLSNINSIAFDTAGVCYAALDSGAIYNLNLGDGTYSQVSTAKIMINGMAFDPKTNELWVCKPYVFGKPKDYIYKVDVNTGDTVFVGRTGVNSVHNDIVFDEYGRLFAVVGSSSQIAKLIEIDKSSGAGVEIGSLGTRDVIGLAYLKGEILTSVAGSNNSNLPTEFSLNQNYPNPFNPTTTIKYGLPFNSNVKVVVYNLLGQAVNTIINERQTAGYHQVTWDASNVSSGVYFYELHATGEKGEQFSKIRKMVLLK